MIVKKIVRPVLVIALALMLVVLAAGTALAAYGNSNGANLQSGSSNNVCTYDGERTYWCGGEGLRDGSCGICPNGGTPKLDGTGGGARINGNCNRIS